MAKYAVCKTCPFVTNLGDGIIFSDTLKCSQCGGELELRN